MNLARFFRDPVRVCLQAGLLGAVLACLPLGYSGKAPVYNAIAVVDITRSMNVEDYRLDGRAASRLEFTRLSLTRLAAELPCGSRLGLAVFTDRRAMLLFEPIETCGGFAAIEGALANLDWRMAWAADSRIGAGLHQTLEMLAAKGASLIFLTDGQEAPPVNPRYRAVFDDVRGKIAGIIVGVGGLTAAPIPKFDENGRKIGYVEAEEVPHRSTFGLPERGSEDIETVHARNAPFGGEAVIGTEHLSSLREDYLKNLAGETALEYRRLEKPEDLLEAAMRPEFATPAETWQDLRWLPALLALMALAAAYLIGGRRTRPSLLLRMELGLGRQP